MGGPDGRAEHALTEKRTPLVPPLGGLSDDQAFANQEIGTSREQVNMRGIDPKTGRRRWAQRAGQTRRLDTESGDTGKIQDLQSVVRDKAQIEYANVTVGGAADVEWSRLGVELADVLWVETDVQGNIYILDGPTTITKYNADGVRLRSISIPVDDNETAVSKIVTDIDGGVYAACFRQDYRTGRLWRFKDSSTSSEELELDWEYRFDGGVTLLDTDGFSVYVVRRFQLGQVAYQMSRLDGGLSGVPEETWTREVPGPINSMEVDLRGAIKVAVGRTDAKGSGAERDGISKVITYDTMWSPHDLQNADERIYFWVDAENIDGQDNATLEDGDEIEVWKDNRFRDTTRGGGPYDPIIDDTERDLIKDDSPDSSRQALRPGPTYSAEGWGGRPCVRFNGGDRTDGGSESTASAGVISFRALAGKPDAGDHITITDREGNWERFEFQMWGATGGTYHQDSDAGAPSVSNTLLRGVQGTTGTLASTVNAFITAVNVGISTTPPVGIIVPTRLNIKARSVRGLVYGVELYYEDGVAGDETIEINSPNDKIRFTAAGVTGQALKSYASTSTTRKQAADETLAGQRTIFPGVAQAPATRAPFITCIALRADPTTVNEGPQVLLSQNGNGDGAGGSPIDYGVLLSAASDGGSPAAPTYSQFGAALHDKSGAGMEIAGASAPIFSEADAFNNGASGMILTIVSFGEDSSPGTQQSEFRINGEVVQSFDFVQQEVDGRSSYTVVGCRRSRQSENGEDLYGDEDGYVSFTGDIRQIITVWGDSSDGVTADTTHNLTIESDVSSTTHWVALHGAEAATDVELLEGYIAHHAGLADLLPHGLRNDTTSFNFVVPNKPNHPFGGAGNFPVSPRIYEDTYQGTSTQESRQAEFREDAALVKYQPGSGELGWAIGGGGFGQLVVSDEDGNTLTFGEGNPRLQTGLPYGPDNEDDDFDVIGRKVMDRGSYAGMDKKARGFVAFRGHNVTTSKPSDGTIITVQGGSDVIFEFDTDSSVSGTNIAVDATGSPSTTMGNLVTAINSQTVLGITARQVGDFSCEMIQDVVGVFGQRFVPSNTDELICYGTTDGQLEDEAWRFTGSTDPEVTGLRAAADDEGDFWVPGFLSSVGNYVYKFDKETGSILLDLVVAPAGESVKAIALPPGHPDYLDQPANPTGPLFLYAATTGGVSETDDLYKVRIVNETKQLGDGTESPREQFVLAVRSGNLYDVSDGATWSPYAAESLEPTSPYISSVVGFNKVFYTDGFKYLVFDPRQAEADRLEPLISRGGGTLPENAKLIQIWNQRLLLARTDDDPFNVYCSRRGDPENWNYFPPVPDGLEAVEFSASRSGLPQDIVNSLMPFDDDLLVIGCDHHVFRLTGDPLAGGQLDLLTDSCGVAFGKAWCKDPVGIMYWFGSRGGVYRLVPGGLPERITRDRIERRMADLDLTKYRVRLEWNWRDEGLHVFATPWNAQTVTVPRVVSWFMDKNGAWWEDEWGADTVWPCASVVADGDLPDDRVLLLGGADGYVRVWDEDAVNDDGVVIDSRGLVGPLVPMGSTGQVKFSRPQVVLSNEQGGANLEIYVSDTAELLNEPVQRVRLEAGMSERMPLRARGSAVWMRFRNASLAERWALERLDIAVARGGRNRPR